MTNEAKIRVLRIYSILLGIVIVIAGLCLMAGCLSIYNSGDQPYSREIVAEVFSKIAIPIYLCLIMVILGFVLSLLLSPEKKTPVAKKARVDKDTEISEADLAKRKKLNISRYVLLAISVCFIVYGLATGGVADVIAKAINICTECIGLG